VGFDAYSYYLNAQAGGGGGADWGNIGGAIGDQTDLQNQFNTKGNLSGGNTWSGTQTFANQIAVTSFGNSTQWNAGYEYSLINHLTEEVDTLATVTARGSTTSEVVSFNNNVNFNSWVFSEDVNGNLILTGASDKDLHVSGNIHAFSDTTPPLSSWWDDMPIAAVAQLGGIKEGSGITIEPDGTANVVGGGTGAVWSQITGDIATQTDLQDELDLKGNLSGGNTWNGGQIINGDIRFNGYVLMSGYSTVSNIDHIWHDDAAQIGGEGGVWNFVSDGTYKSIGNSRINANSFYANGYIVATQYWVDTQGFLKNETSDLQAVISRDNAFTTAMNYSPNSGTLLSIDSIPCVYRTTAGGGMAFGANDGTILGAGEALSAIKSNVTLSEEKVHIGGEGGVRFYAFPNNDTTWSNRKEMIFSDSGTLTVPTSISVPNLYGNASTATLATTATQATKVTVTNSGSSAEYPIVWHNNSNSLYDTTGSLMFQASTGQLTSRLMKINRASSSDEAVIRYATNSVNDWLVGVDNNTDSYDFYSYSLGTQVMSLNKTTGQATITGDVRTQNDINDRAAILTKNGSLTQYGVAGSLLNLISSSTDSYITAGGLSIGSNSNQYGHLQVTQSGNTSSDGITVYNGSRAARFWCDSNDITSIDSGGSGIYGMTLNRGGGQVAIGTSTILDSTLTLNRASGKPSIKSTDGWLIMESLGTGVGRVSLNHYNSDDILLCNGGGNVIAGANIEAAGDIIAYA